MDKTAGFLQIHYNRNLVKHNIKSNQIKQIKAKVTFDGKNDWLPIVKLLLVHSLIKEMFDEYLSMKFVREEYSYGKFS